MSTESTTNPSGGQEGSIGGQHPGHHHHVHHHGHGHHHGHERTEANKAFFNAHAEIYDIFPHSKERANRTALAITNSTELDKETTTVLEFACGNGLVARALLPSVKAITGVDISEEAVKRFNAESEKQGTQDRCQAVSLNLETDYSALEGETFDLVYCASAYHHFENPETITKLLVSLLKSNGTFIVVDISVPEGAEPSVDEKLKDVVSRVGFTETDMKKLFEGAGVKFEKYEMIPEDEGDADIFIAKGVKV